MNFAFVKSLFAYTRTHIYIYVKESCYSNINRRDLIITHYHLSVTNLLETKLQV